jgi:hypothetical protein
MQRPVHIVRHARPEALEARSGMGASCVVDPGTPRGGLVPSGLGKGTEWAKIGLGRPEIPGHFSRSIGQDRRERYRQRGRTVARP